MRKIYLIVIVFWSFSVLPAGAENYTVNGRMASRIGFQIEKNVKSVPAVSKMTLSFVVPPSFKSPTYSQDISNFRISFVPEPQKRTRVEDKRGNTILTGIWNKNPDSIRVLISFDASNNTELQPIETTAPFPLATFPQVVSHYLEATEQVQSRNERIVKLAKELTHGVSTEFDAVQRVLSWLVDNVRYVTPPARYDALYSLESGKGNCQNYSHLAAALMRSVGIPVRIVNGVTLDKPFNIERDRGVFTVKMGKGRHSWIEVWFPDLGWVPLDPQQTAMFVANRFIRIEVGIDNRETVNDGRLLWSQRKGSKERPLSREAIDADFTIDKVKIAGNREEYGPKNILIAPRVKGAFKKVEYMPSPPPPVIPEEREAELRYDVPYVYGNVEFPENIDFAFPPTPTMQKGVDTFEQTRDFYVETAEYVTTKLTQYAQIFILERPVKLSKIGLALHKFGGNGQMWVELFQNNGGSPGEILATSDMVDLSELSQRPGYRWQDFAFDQEKLALMPGAYWIGLGYTGSPIVNWFFTYGKPVGPVDGTRYKSIYDEEWSGALSYEFNYRVIGRTVK